MCGRYEFKLSDSAKSKQIETELVKLNLTYKQGEIFPSDSVICIIPKKDKVTISKKKWGIKTKSLLINARIETINDRPTYREIMDNRCAIICNGFYEWHNKEKYYISFKEEFMYLAAIYNSNNELVILTKASGPDFSMIHDRIPIIMNQKEMLTYLFNIDKVFKDKELIVKGVK